MALFPFIIIGNYIQDYTICKDSSRMKTFCKLPYNYLFFSIVAVNFF